MRSLYEIAIMSAFAGACTLGAIEACTPAQVATLKTAEGPSVALVGCVVLSALDGASLAGVVASCGSDAITVGTILLSVAEEAGTHDAGLIAGLQADRIRGSAAYIQAKQAVRTDGGR